jgi:uncharacterized membrane protein
MPVTPANPARPDAMRLPWFGLALLACAALAIAGAITHRHALSFAAAVVLLLAWLPSAWRRHSLVALGAWLALATLLLVPAGMGHPELALSILPVVFLAVAAWLFGRTLLPGAEPLVSRFVRVIEGEARLSLPGVCRYTRGVTVFWACLLGCMTLLSLLIALFAVPGGWLSVLGIMVPAYLPGSLLEWYPEAGCWTLLAAAFVGEYLFRRWYLRGIPHPSVKRFATQIIRRWPMLMRGGDEHA